jgi:hypothetical protein
MKYMEKYSNNDLFDMFANEANFAKLANQTEEQVYSDLLELAPDMEDAEEVAAMIKKNARTIALNNRFGPNRNK